MASGEDYVTDPVDSPARPEEVIAEPKIESMSPRPVHRLSLSSDNDLISVSSPGGREKDDAVICGATRPYHGGVEDFQTGKKKMFVDQDAMKTKLRERMSKPAYDVTNFYYTTGHAQRIARSTVFEISTLVVIALNAVWISIDTDWNKAETVVDASWPFQIMENLFCAYFSWEWLVRFLAFKRKLNGLHDRWFIFDSLLVALMVFETWVMSVVILLSGGGGGGGLGNASIMRMARLLRLTRMARMARLLRSMPELMILVRGMFAATRSVVFTLMLLITFLYVFAIGFTQTCEGTDLGNEWFGNVAQSMHTLLVYGTFMDEVSQLTSDLQRRSPLMLIPFYMYVLLGSLTLLNMLIGVLCEVVTAVASTEKEAMTIAYVRDAFYSILRDTGLDANSDGKISKTEFMQIFHSDKAISLIEEVGVDVLGLVSISDFVFDDGTGKEVTLTYDDLMKLILDLRGSNAATVRDIVDLRKYVRQQFGALQHPPARENRNSELSMVGTTTINSRQCSPDDSARPLLRELLDETADEFKKWVKDELRCHLASMPRSAPWSYKSSCGEKSSSNDTGPIKPHKATAVEANGVVNNSLKPADLLECIDLSSLKEDEAEPWRTRLLTLEGGAKTTWSATGVSSCDDLGLVEETLCANGVSDLLVRFQSDTKEMQEHLGHVMERVDVLDVKLGSLAELVVPGGRSSPRHTETNSVTFDSTAPGQKSVRQSELLHSLCSSKKEMQYNLECVMQKAHEQHRRFVVLSQLVVSVRQDTQVNSTPEFVPQVSRRRISSRAQSFHANNPDNARRPSDSNMSALGCGASCS